MIMRMTKMPPSGDAVIGVIREERGRVDMEMGIEGLDYDGVGMGIFG